MHHTETTRRSLRIAARRSTTFSWGGRLTFCLTGLVALLVLTLSQQMFAQSNADNQDGVHPDVIVPPLTTAVLPGVPTVQGNINTVVGSHTAGTDVNGPVQATAAKLTLPSGLAFDTSGNLFIADSSSGTGGSTKVYKVDTTGQLTLIAGNATGAVAPSGAAAATSWIRQATGIAFDSAGNLFVSSASDFVIDEIPAGNPIMQVFAGVFNTPATTTTYGEGVSASTARFFKPMGIAFDKNDNLYVVDGGNGAAIRMIAKGTNIVTTIAGKEGTKCTSVTKCGDGGLASAATFSVPQNLYVDADNNIFIVDGALSSLRVIYNGGAGVACLIALENPTLFPNFAGTTCSGATSPQPTTGPQQGYIYSLIGMAGNCPSLKCGDNTLASTATLDFPVGGLAVDAAGNIYINDLTAGEVREINANTGIISPVMGSLVNNPTAAHTFASAGDNGPALKAEFGASANATIGALAFDGHGNLFLADTGFFNIRAATGIGVVALPPQTITFNALTPVTYGTPAISLSAVANSGLTVTYQVISGPATVSGNQLTVTGAGSVVIEADQSGDSSNAAATPVQQSLTVNPAVLTVTPDNQTMAQGGTVPNLTYTITGFVNGDTQSSVVTGSPQLTTLASSSSAPGSYPITGTTDNLTATNYTFTLAATSTVTVVAKTTQMITFNQIPAQAYGNPPINLNNYFSSNNANIPLTYTTSSANASISATTGILTITAAGIVVVKANQAGDATHMAATEVMQSFNVAQASLTVQADSLSRPFRQSNPMLTYTIIGFVNGDTQATATTGTIMLSTTATPTSVLGNYPITFSSMFSSAPNYMVTYKPGQLTVTGSVAQTITFTQALANVTYGASSITLTASSSSGLPIAYTVSGPAAVSGSVLTITGAGNVVVTANQPGDANYAAATPVSRSFAVAQSVLTFTADTLQSTVGSPIPPLTYTVTGFVNADTQATVTTGAPSLATSATSSSGVGSYQITIAKNTLVATNYTFSFVNGMLNIVNKTAQTITFASLPNVIYGAPSVTLTAMASSGIPATYTVSGPATISGSRLTITGAGQIVVTASQAGDNTYAAATPVPQSFTVAPAILTVKPADASRLFGAANPTFTYTLIGFVNNDIQATATTGSPVLTTTATPTSPAGTYPITGSQGTLSSSSYTFASGTGMLTVTSATNTITFQAIPSGNETYGAVIPLNATASSGLPVTYTVVGPVNVSNSNLTITGIGPVSVTANQTGNANYVVANPVTQSFMSRQAVLTVTAQPATRSQGAANPTFTATITGFVNGDANTPLVLTGQPFITTTATPASPAGTYPITPSLGTLFSANYTFAFVPDVLTVLGTPTYTVTASPSALTIPLGQSRQASLLVQSANTYQGSVTFSCGQVPLGLNCSFSPATVTLVANPNQTSQTNVSTLTITTTGPSATLHDLRGQGNQAILAGMLLVPGGLAGLLLIFQRKKLRGHQHVRQLLSFLILCSATVGMMACGSSNNRFEAPMGASTILITSTGTGVSGSGSQNQSNILSLTVTVVPAGQITQ